MIAPPLDSNGELHVAKIVDMTEAQPFYREFAGQVTTIDHLHAQIAIKGQEPTQCAYCGEPCEFPYSLHHIVGADDKVTLSWLRFKCIACSRTSATRRLQQEADRYRQWRMRMIPSEIRQWKNLMDLADREWTAFCRQMVIDKQLELRTLKGAR